LAGVLEYEAARYAKEGDLELAKAFKSATLRALSVTEEWLRYEPISHIKNRFPVETKFGCEGYGYFDKYMITAASNLYNAYLACDEEIPAEERPDEEPCVFRTSEFFHKVFLKSGGYALELDTNGDPHYDASGLGRVHRAGAPSVLCLSVPCPADPLYTLLLEERMALTLCPGIFTEGAWKYATDASASYEVTDLCVEEEVARAEVLCRFPEGSAVKTSYAVGTSGVEISVKGEGRIAYLLPALDFDGETHAEIQAEDSRLTVSFGGWRCVYTTNGRVWDLHQMGENRNGQYRAYAAEGEDSISLWIQIEKE
jgi:hypothetical protein